MNAPVLLAQLSGSSPQASGSPGAPPKNLKIEKPQNGQAVSVHLDGQTKLDFSDVASEKLTFVRIGDRLIVLFDNQSTVTVEPVFDSSGHPLADIAFAMGADRTLSGEQFAELFPITTDQSVLPAAGGNGPTAGAHFGDPHVDPLSIGTPLDLLGAETFGSTFNPLNNEVPNPTPIVGTADVASINEDGLAGGNPGGTGDEPGALSVTGSLHVNFGTDAIGRSFAFAADQPTLTALTSDGQAVHLFFTTIGGLPTMIGYIGADPSIAANQVFTVSLDATTLEGTYTFTLLRPLDHPILGTEDTLNLSINVTATDGSGDTAPVVIHVNVNDDTPVIVAANETHSTLTDPLFSFTPATQSGLLGISWGADRFNDHVDGGVSATNGHTGDRSVVFTDNFVTMTGHPPSGGAQPVTFTQLFSRGDEVHFALLNNGTVLMAYTGNVVPSLPASGGDSEVSGDIVFVATLSDASDTGSYVITQYQPLDHNVGAQTFDSIDLSFHFTATDSDGDPASGNLTVTVADTVPAAGPGDAAAVNEPDLTTQTGFDQSFDAATDTASAGFFDGGVYGALAIHHSGDNGIVTKSGSGNYALVTQTTGGPFTRFGGDDSSFDGGFKASVDIYLDPAKLASGEGFDYSVAVNDQAGNHLRDFIFHVTKDTSTGLMLVGASNNTGFDPIENLEDGQHGTITSGGWYTFEEVFHAAVGGTLAVDMVVRNAAGVIVFTQTLNNPADLLSTMVGGHRYGWFTNIDVAGGIAIDNVSLTQHDDATSPTSVSGSLHLAPGADGLGSLTFAGIVDGAAVIDTANHAVTSGHQAVYYHIVDSHTLVGATQSGQTIFTVTLDPVWGNYTFTLEHAIDHPDANVADSLGMQFGYTLTDGDGDTASSSFTVTVNDDLPTAGPGGSTKVNEQNLTTQTGFDQSFDAATNASTAGFVDGGIRGALAIHTSGDNGIVTKSGSGNYALVTQTDGGPFTQFGGYDSSFDGGFKASVDIYLDPSKLAAGEGFDYSVAVNNQAGVHLRDFVFHVTKDTSTGLLLVGAGNGSSFAPVENLEDGPNGTITAGGWYTFEEVFHAAADGSLAVDMVVRNAAGVIVFTQTLNNPADLLSTMVGGHRYGWFTNIDVAGGIAIDNVSLTQHDDATSPTSVSGSLHLAPGADGLGSLTFAGIVDGAAVTDTGNNAVMSGHQAVYYHVVDSHTLVGATQAGETIFTVTLDPVSGNYTFTLEHGIDHPVPDVADGLGLQFGYTLTDGDNDSASSSFIVTVNDSLPSVDTSAVGSVSEDGPLGLTAAPLAVDWGADNSNVVTADRSLAFTDNLVTVADPAGHAVALTSYGVAVSIGFIGDVLVGYTGGTVPGSTADPRIVFFASLSDVTSSYDFTLKQPLDHAAPVGHDSYLDLTFDITATDSDGDHATGTFTVRVDAAGSIGSIDYDNETTGVFVNLDSQQHTYDGQTVAAGRSTDITGQGPVIGIDNVTGLANAHGGSGDDILVGSSVANNLSGGVGQDLLVVVPDTAGPAASVLFDHGDGTPLETISTSGRASSADNLHGGVGYDTVQLDLDGSSATGFVFDRTGSGSPELDGVEQFIGSDGNDIIMLPTNYTTDGSGVTVNGGKGDDVISGSNNAESLFGGEGNDKISGLGGNDDLHGNSGDDQIWGGAGNDTIHGDFGDDTITGGLGDDTLYGDNGNDLFIYKFGDGHDTIDGGAGSSNRLNVTGNNDEQSLVMTATTATDFTVETDGDSTPEITATNVQKVNIAVGGGHDTVTIVDGDNDDTITVTGAAHDFTIDGTNLPSTHVTNANTGTLDFRLGGGAGNDSIDASALNSAGSPQTLNVTLDGGAGNDTITGANGADTLNGDAGNDILSGGAGNDTIDGGTNDALSFQGNINAIAWTPGVGDVVDYGAITTGVFVNVGATDATVDTGSGFETLVAGQARDRGAGTQVGIDTLSNIEVVIGGSGADVIVGGGQSSWLIGGAGADRIYGGDGNEFIWTGTGSPSSNPLDDGASDIVRADGGNDVIVYGGGDDIDGGSGDDVIISIASFVGATLAGGTGDDQIMGTLGDDIINYTTGDGSDVVDGSTGTDRLNVNGDGNNNAFIVANGDPDPTRLEVTVDGATSLVKNVDDIYFTGNGGNDTLTVSGNLNGTGLAQSTIHFDGGSGNDTVNAAGLTSAHGIDFTGGTGNDRFVSSAAGGNDRFDGGSNDGLVFVASVPGSIPGSLASYGLASGRGDEVDYSAITTGVFVNLGATDAFVDTGLVSETLAAGQARDRGAATQVGTDTLSNVEVVVGGSGDDVLVGGSQSSWLIGGGGTDRIYGGSGNEFIYTDGRASNGFSQSDGVFDIVRAGSGNDVIIIGSGGADVDGGSGNDVIIGSDTAADSNTITGGLGNDQIYAGNGNDTIIYNTGDGSDFVEGAPGVDRLNVNGDATANAFAVSNGDGDPTSLEVTVDGATSLVKGVEDIYFTGNGGNDTLTVSGDLNGTGLAQSTIHFDGGAGNDTVDVSGLVSKHHVVFDGGDDSDTLIIGNAPGEASWVGSTITESAGDYTITTADGRVFDAVNVESFQFSDGTFSASQLIEQAPTGLTTTGLAVAENSAVGTVVGSVVGADANGPNDHLTYAFFDGTNTSQTHGAFTINATTGAITVANSTLLDYETIPGHALSEMVRVTDSHGLSKDVAVTINVTDVNDAPIIADPGYGQVMEDFNRTAVQGERVANGDFSAGINNWTTTNVNPDYTGLVTAGGSTAYSMYTFNSAVPTTLSQTLQTTAGVTYDVSFSLNHRNSGSNSVTVYWGGVAYLALQDIPASGSYDTFTQYSFKALATSASTTFAISEVSPSTSVTFDNISVVAATSETATGTLNFTDDEVNDHHSVSASAQGLGYVGTFDAQITNSATGDGAGQITWVFNVENSQIQYLSAGAPIQQVYTVSITDSTGSTTSKDVTITIQGTNDAPTVAHGIVDQNEAANTPFTFQFAANTFNDVDVGDTLTYTASLQNGSALPSWLHFDASTRTFSGTPGDNDGSVSVKVTATDGSNASVSDTFDIVLPHVNHAPVLDAGAAPSGQITKAQSFDNSSRLHAPIIDHQFVLSADSDIQNATTVPHVSIQATGADHADYYAFTALAGTTGTFDIDHTSSGFNGYLNLFDASGNYLAWNDNSTSIDAGSGTKNDSFLTYTFTTGGTYFIEVESHSTEYVQNGATYELNVSLANGLTTNPGVPLTTEERNAGAPVGTVGTLVSDLIDLPGNGGHDNVTDADNGAQTGIALTGTDAANGTWWYSTDHGQHWNTVGTVSNSQALLLSADADTRLYFQPTADWYGPITDAITYRAWDQSNGSGLAGHTADTTSNGGTTAYSSGTDTSSLIIHAANTPGADVVLTNVTGAIAIPETALIDNDDDVDGNPEGDINTVGNPIGGTVSFNGSTVTFTDDATLGGSFTYTLPGGEVAAAVTVNYVASSTITGGEGAEVIVGSGNADLLIGNGGRDFIYGNGGNDIIRGGAGSDILDGGAGIDLLDYSDQWQTPNATGIDGINIDSFRQSSGLNVVYQNIFDTFSNVDWYYNMEGVIGSAYNDRIVGYSGGGNDIFIGGAGDDQLYGLAGNDTLRGGSGNDILDGGAGTGDLLDMSDAGGALNFTLVQSSSSTQVDLGYVGLGYDVYYNMEGVIGSNFNDTLTGSSSADFIQGGAGNDVITGGKGADTLTGGVDADTFVYNSGDTVITIGGSVQNGTIAGYDIIADFDPTTDFLNMVGTPVVATATTGFNGVDSTLRLTSTATTTIKSDAISNGIITFSTSDAFGSPVSLTSTANVAAVVQYLERNSIGAGATVAFTATISSVVHTYVYQQVGSAPNAANDILVDLQGVSIANLSTLITNGHVDPIILDLGNDGIALSSLSNGVQFDINGDGVKDHIAWTAGNDGILAMDLDGSGKIENGTEIFSPVFGGGHFADGLAALASLDSNHDGKIDSADAAFSKLLVWQDLNHNGVSDAGELTSLTDHDIATILLDATASTAQIDGQAIAAIGTFVNADGSTGNFVEVAFDVLDGAANGSLQFVDAAHVTDADFAGHSGITTLQLGDFANSVTLGDNASTAIGSGTLTIDDTAAMSATSTLKVDGSSLGAATHLHVLGGAGNDNLTGGAGDDTIAGGKGNDTLKGGGGADIFVFADSGAGHVDTILDYSAGQHDKIDLSGLLDTAFGAGSNESDFVRLFNSGSNVTVQVNTAGAANGANWSDVAVLQDYHAAGNQVLVQFEQQTHQLTVAA
jgi:T1SS-143 domain-containing protein